MEGPCGEYTCHFHVVNVLTCHTDPGAQTFRPAM